MQQNHLKQHIKMQRTNSENVKGSIKLKQNKTKQLK